MRRVFAILSATVLALAMTAPIVSAQEGPYVTNVVVQSVTVDRTGEMRITGTLYCQNMDGWNLDIQGQVIEAIGHKVTIRGGIGGGLQCEPNGPTYWEAGAWADNGKFSTGWATLQLQFGGGGCDENGCWWDQYGWANPYVKVTKS